MNYLFCFIARTIFLVLRSALAFCREITAQIAAGIQPIKVICNTRHRTPVNILPLKKKDNQGNKMAISVIVIQR